MNLSTLKPVALAVALGCASGVALADGSSDFYYLGTKVATFTWSSAPTDATFSLTLLSAPDPDAFVFSLEFQGPNGTFTDTDAVEDSTGTYGLHTDASLQFTWEVLFENSGGPSNPARLAIGDTATWTITPGPADSFSGDPKLIHINAFLNGESIKLVPGIPEPSTYAMMFAGLGVVGFMARRRQRQA